MARDASKQYAFWVEREDDFLGNTFVQCSNCGVSQLNPAPTCEKCGKSMMVCRDKMEKQCVNFPNCDGCEACLPAGV